MHPADPHTLPEIVHANRSVEAEVATFFGGLSDEHFLLRVGDAWNPAEHWAHLCTTVNAVSRGLAAPKWLLRLRFGRARAPSRGFAEVRDTYRAALAAGGRAPARFVPPRAEGSAEERRAALLDRWSRASSRLRDALGRWSEAEVDRLVLPHPLLGKLTVREMMLFALYHDLHHVEGARRRLPVPHATE